MRAGLLLVLGTSLLDVSGKPDMRVEVRQPVIPCPSKWKLIHAEYGGEAIQTADMWFTHTPATGNCLWVFALRKDEVIVNHHWAHYRLKPNVVPAELDFRNHKGIYAFAGGRLKVCFAAAGEPRPRSFRTSAQDNRLLMILKQESP